MRGAVPKRLFAVGIVKGENLHGAVVFNGGAKVAALAVDFCGAGDSGKTGADAFRNLIGGDAVFVFANIVTKLNFYHIILYLLYNYVFILQYKKRRGSERK